MAKAKARRRQSAPVPKRREFHLGDRVAVTGHGLRNVWALVRRRMQSGGPRWWVEFAEPLVEFPDTDDRDFDILSPTEAIVSERFMVHR